MRTLFDELRQDGFAVIRRLKDERQQESVTLDFKEKKDARHGGLTREDRQTLAENLSAFANSAGGLLIFGVTARKDEDGVDAASEICPIGELARFQSEVTHAAGDLLLPRHEGIEILAIVDPAKPDTGCLAIWVERSERRPHQSQAAKDRRYYKRAGDNTFVMEHYDIEDAFRRITVPDLSLSFRVVFSRRLGGGFGTLNVYRVVFSLENGALVTARFPYLHFLERTGLHPSWHDPMGLRWRYQAGQLCFDGHVDDIIHPEQSLEVAGLEVGIITGKGLPSLVDLSSGGVAPEQMPRVPLEGAHIAYSCCFGAENCRMRKHDYRISPADFAKLIPDK